MTTSLKTSKRMTTIPPYFFDGLNQRIARLKAEGKDVIRMDMGSPDLPPAQFIVDGMKQSADDSTNHGYQPFGGIPTYREAWSNFYGKRFGVELDPKTELAGLLGSKEGIFNLSLAYVDQGDVVLVPDPGYAPYTNGALFAGGEVVYMPLLAKNNFLPDLKSISPDVLKRVKIMWLNYPNNPTGAVATLEFFAEVVALARQYNFLVAHDAPYTEITFDGYVAPSILQIPNAKEVCVEFSSCSKTYNMGGWRLGVVCGNTQVVKALGTLKSNIDSGHFKPLMDAASLALTTDQSWLIDRNEQYRQRRDIVVKSLREAGMKVDTPAAAIYVWAKLPDGVDDATYAANLLQTANVSVTPGTVFGPSGAGYIRISLGTPTPKVKEAMQRIKNGT